jgi:hypothetical protein
MAERLYLALIAPRGIVAAAVAAIFALELAEGHGSSVVPIAEASRLVPVTYTVIVGTVAFYGLLAGPLARRLGLAVRNPQGLLIAGITEFTIECARAFRETDIRVVLVDSNYDATTRARMRGVTAVSASITSEFVTDELDHAGIGRLLAATPNDHVNTIACLHFAPLFGHANVYQLNHVDEEETTRDGVSAEFTGRVLFEGGPTFDDLDARTRRGFQIKKTSLTEEFTLKHFRTQRGPEALVLFTMNAKNELLIHTPESSDPGPGDTLIALVPGDPTPTT